jgi:hypothetical protein
MLVAAIIFMIAGFAGMIYVGVHIKRNTRVIKKPNKFVVLDRSKPERFDEHA